MFPCKTTNKHYQYANKIQRTDFADRF